MGRDYQILGARGSKKLSKKDRKKLKAFLSENDQALVPLVELIEQSRLAVDGLVDEVGRVVIEIVLELSAKAIAGRKRPGKASGSVCWHGRQGGSVVFSDRKLRVERPRLRRKGVGRGGEVAIPAYERMQDDEALGGRVLDILMRGVSTRNYGAVIGEMTEEVGIARSSVSRRFIEAGKRELSKLLERRFDDVDILIVYIDGQRFAEHHVISAVGVDHEGYKHVLGMYAGATENETVVKGLLEDLVDRGVKSDRKRLFVIDGSKALRKAIDAVYGWDNPVQRCRKHKLKNVMDHLPDELKDQVKAVLKAAWRLPWKEGIARLERQARWLENEYPSAAASIREGLKEIFTVNRLDLPPSLCRCLTSTNIIESPQSGVRTRTRRVSRWKSQKMVLYWAASAWTATERNFRRIQGYRDLWMLKAALAENKVAERREVV